MPFHDLKFVLEAGKLRDKLEITEVLFLNKRELRFFHFL
jgi:hypothetical protein